MPRLILSMTLLILALAAPAAAQPYPPTFEFTSIMKNYFDDRTGLLQLGDFVVGFAPEGPFNAEVGVVDANNNVLGRFNFRKEKGEPAGVFQYVSVENPAEVTITTPGGYYLVFVVDAGDADDPVRVHDRFQVQAPASVVLDQEVVETVVLGRSAMIDGRFAAPDVVETVVAVYPDGLSRHTFMTAVFEIQKVRALVRREVDRLVADAATGAELERLVAESAR